ncbi:bromodomain-containing protein [Canna indica]|uniref:Bromodomain-containing protein n=1 Tax=Canna indica TaxID=4628 RepID=A0AAQ3QH27_9LILI|nr:bromodomain-containing protein [Canna indica]
MNSSNFMDKQIMELSGSSQPASEFFDLINPKDCQINGASEEGTIRNEEQHREAEILPNYDFQPIRTVGSSSLPTSVGAGLSGSWPSWNSVDSKLASSNLKNAGILDPHELTKVSYEKEKKAYDTAVVAEIDCTVKRYADNLMNALEEVSSRLSKLESRTQHLESSVDELKVAIGNNNGSIDGRLRQIENVLKEVHSVAQIVQDKQNTMEARLHLLQLNGSKEEQQRPESSKSGQPDSLQHEVSPQQPIRQPYQHSVPPAPTTMLPAVPMPNAPLPAPQQSLPPNIPQQLPPSQIPSVPSLPREPYLSAAQHTEAPNQQYQSHIQQAQAIPPSQQQHYHPAPQLPQYSQPLQSQQPATLSPQLSPAMAQHPEESLPYMPAPQSYPQSIQQPASFPQPVNGPSQQFYGPNTNMYEPHATKLSSGLPPFSSGYGQLEPSYAYSGLPSSQSNSISKPLPFASSVPSGGSSKYPRLPTAQILPQATPTGPGSGASSGTRVPIDDVVDKVSTMGFSKDQVRATVRKLTENGQSVDLNVVLDKLMNDGEIQPQKGWFGR